MSLLGGLLYRFEIDGDKAYRYDAGSGKYVRSLLMKDGRKVPIFGLDCHQGHTGNANFSWLLQMKAQSETPPPDAVMRAATQPTSPPSINTPGSDPQQIRISTTSTAK